MIVTLNAKIDHDHLEQEGWSSKRLNRYPERSLDLSKRKNKRLSNVLIAIIPIVIKQTPQSLS
jgi:hypothetical protein